MTQDMIDEIVQHVAAEFPSFAQKKNSVGPIMLGDVFTTPVFALGVDIQQVVVSVITQYRAKLGM